MKKVLAAPNTDKLLQLMHKNSNFCASAAATTTTTAEAFLILRKLSKYYKYCYFRGNALFHYSVSIQLKLDSFWPFFIQIYGIKHYVKRFINLSLSFCDLFH